MDILPEVKLDLTESASTAAKAATELMQTALTEPIKSTGKLATTAVDFLRNFLLYPMQKYNIYAENKLNEFKQSLEEKVKQIPDGKLAQPTISIWGNVCDSLKWNLDEEHIKTAFVNILMSDINSDTKAKVNPAFVEIVKQLSSSDANLLKLYFLGNGIEVIDVLMSIRVAPTVLDGFYAPNGINTRNHEFYAYIWNDEVIKLDDVNLDNLERLKLISIRGGYIDLSSRL